MDPLPLAAALLLVATHLGAPALRSLRGVPRSIWLSLFGGVSVAYVFVHLLPELAQGQRHVDGTAWAPAAFAQRHVYVVALAGLATFYGLERLAKVSRTGAVGDDRDADVDEDVATTAGVFWVHMASFTVYNALIGYLLLHRDDDSATELLLFSVAMALHFVVTDFGLAEHHKHRYARTGRWLLVAAVLAGVAVGAATEVDEAALAVLVAFLAGGVILNVLKEEVPTERRSRFWAFGLGIVAYTALLLAFE